LDSYLDLAELVLSAAKRPLSPRAILDAAYKAGTVPSHLFGKAQHKTLQARLSEDILRLKLNSRFYRTDPGVFFLSAFRSDPTIADDLKDPFHARRRTRDLAKPSALAVDRNFLESTSLWSAGWREFFHEADHQGALRYVDARKPQPDWYLIWAFSIVRRSTKLLSYRIGRYRDKRDTFINRRSIGFADVVGDEDANLFNKDLGIADRGLTALLDDLDLSRSVFGPREDISSPNMLFYLIAKAGQDPPALLVVLEWICPEWFEPTARRLSLNEVRWVDSTRRPNDLDDFEPWSAAAFSAIVEGNLSSHYEEKNKRPADRVYRI
jgi:hypothetical protein